MKYVRDIALQQARQFIPSKSREFVLRNVGGRSIICGGTTGKNREVELTYDKNSRQDN